MTFESNHIISTSGLSKYYGKVQALKSVDLTVPRHSITGFLGPNGAGKSTAIRLLLGLARPTSGTGSIFGLDIVKDSAEIRRRVGYLSQQPRFYDHMTSREVLRFTARFFFRGPRQAIEERIQEVLELVGLANSADRPVRGFSGGERQRLGIAQAQINYPDLLILDEPAASLDPMGRRDILNVMERLRKHTTIFYSTHILDDVQRVSDRVVILNQGLLIAQGRIEDLLSSQMGLVYTLIVEGDLSSTRSRIIELPWVISENITKQNGNIHWQIQVDNDDAAKAHLLRAVLADPAIHVLEFGRQKLDLEQVFLNLVEGEKPYGSQ